MQEQLTNLDNKISSMEGRILSMEDKIINLFEEVNKKLVFLIEGQSIIFDRMDRLETRMDFLEHSINKRLAAVELDVFNIKQKLKQK